MAAEEAANVKGLSSGQTIHSSADAGEEKKGCRPKTFDMLLFLQCFYINI